MDRQTTKKNADVLWKRLCLDGLASFSIGADADFRSQMVDLVESIGTPNGHSANGEYVWDVKPLAGVNGQLPRSHTSAEFAWHTDASFEEPPPRFVALCAVQHDRYGGGQFQLVKVADVLSQLSPQSWRLLADPCYSFRVPAEFHKGVNRRELPIRFQADSIRYRREIIETAELAAQYKIAIGEFDEIIESTPPIVPYFDRGTLLLFDNWRYLHARTEIRDLERHILRMRFDPKLPL